jgi:hypothetical protein
MGDGPAARVVGARVVGVRSSYTPLFFDKGIPPQCWLLYLRSFFAGVWSVLWARMAVRRGDRLRLLRDPPVRLLHLLRHRQPVLLFRGGLEKVVEASRALRE